MHGSENTSVVEKVLRGEMIFSSQNIGFTLVLCEVCMQELILLLLLTTNQEGLNPKRRMIRLEI
jgi:hypothetical protein